ncbi:MAG: hydrogenase maturation protease, partial [Bryobacteraceae bacterium]
IEPDNISDASDGASIVNSHSLNPVRVLALAKSMGVQLKKVLLVGCEPFILERDESGHIGLSEPVAAVVGSAVQIIRQLVEEFTEKGEVCSHEYV